VSTDSVIISNQLDVRESMWELKQLHQSRWLKDTISKPEYGVAETKSEVRNYFATSLLQEKINLQKKTQMKTKWATDENCRKVKAYLTLLVFTFPLHTMYTLMVKAKVRRSMPRQGKAKAKVNNCGLKTNVKAET